ncbi:MAG TPA: hypothetical protein DEQ38_11760 [Elusimicrobia bacterium]|nr:hypothetical protein [Elusimicrobiota bacterium]
MRIFSNSYMALAALLAAPAAITAAVFAACLHLECGYALAAACLCGLTAAAISYMVLRRGLLRPLRAAINGIAGFTENKYQMKQPLSREGWPEAAMISDSLNRLMLELGAFRSFHLNQVVEERGKAQALIDAISDGVLLLDDGGRLIHANRTALKLLGIRAVDPEAQLCAMVTVEKFRLALQEISTAPEKYHGTETSLPATDENCSIERHFRIISTSFPLSTLKRPGRVVVIRDVTADKEMDNARETLFHMITHDMRSPVTSIQGYAQLMQKAIAPEPMTGIYLQHIFRSANRLKGMIDDILNTVLMTRGNMQLTLGETDAAAFCERVISGTNTTFRHGVAY